MAISAYHTDTIEELFRISGFDLLPPTDNEFSIGSVAFSLKDIHVQNIVYAGALAGNWEPSADDTYLLGSATKGWIGLHLPDTFIVDDPGVVKLRNSVNDAYVDLEAMDIQLAGTTTALTFSNAATIVAGSGLTLPAFAMGGQITGGGQSITGLASLSFATGANRIIFMEDVAEDKELTLRGGPNAGGSGGLILIHGHADATQPGAIRMGTSNAAGNADVIRIDLSGAAATAELALTNVTVTGIVLSGDLEFGPSSLDLLGPSTDDGFFEIKAKDSGVGMVAVASVRGASDPFIALGGGQEFKFTNAGLVGFFGATPVAQPSAYTQTYATADKTIANPTCTSMGDLGATDAGWGASSEANFDKITTAIDQIIADNLDLRQALTALVDDLQSLGLLQ